MSEPTLCPQCGAELPAGAPDQPCPACLMKLGMASWAAAGGIGLAETSAPSGGFEAPALENLAPLFPQLEFDSLLGKGGMGAVYLATQKSLDRKVAVKLINPIAAENPGFAERFAREAKALAKLNHPHIVTVYDFGKADGHFYLLMEYVEGANIRELLRDGLLTPEEALAIVPQVCDALQFAHDAGIVHRDIKPENILVDKNGRVKIADFGLAKLVRTAAHEITLTADNQAMGTLNYMAPEQMERPLEVDHRADIYSLGVTLYEMLTGELPLGRFAAPSEKVRVDVRLDEVVLRALEKEPGRRYQHASDVKTDVESITSSANAVAVKQNTGAAVGEEAVYAPGLGSKLLAIAISMVLSVLISTIGVAMIAVGLWMLSDSHARWAFIAGGAGTLLGGLGSIFGVWNSYRQLKGGGDLMRDPRWTWVDTLFAALGLFGVITLAAAGWWWADLSMGARLTMLLLGSIVALNGLGMEIWRWSERQSARRAAGEPVFLDARLLLIAGGLLFSAILTVAGTASLVIGTLYMPGGPELIGAWLGGGFGCAIGGAGGLLGCWNGYRKLEGAPDMWQSGEVTWFDWAIGGELLLGLGFLAAALLVAAWHSDVRWTLGLMGGIMLFQGSIFALVRWLTIRAARQERE